MTQHQCLLIIDFGSQVTQLIARRLRELNVYCEIRPYQTVTEATIREMAPLAVILSGGPDSVTREGSPRAPQALFEMGLPIFGICYGQQVMMEQLGGKVEAGHHAEYGRAYVAPSSAHKSDGIFAGGLFEADGREQVWMSHGDRVTALAPGFEVIGTSPNAPFAITADEARGFYAVQFHPPRCITRRTARRCSRTSSKWQGSPAIGRWALTALKPSRKSASRSARIT